MAGRGETRVIRSFPYKAARVMKTATTAPKREPERALAPLKAAGEEEPAAAELPEEEDWPEVAEVPVLPELPEPLELEPEPLEMAPAEGRAEAEPLGRRG